MKKLALLMCVASLFLMNCSMQKKGTNKYVEFNNQNTNLENKQLNSSVSFFPAEEGEMSGKMKMMGMDFEFELTKFEMNKVESTVLYSDKVVKKFLRDEQNIVMAIYGIEEVVNEHGPLEGEEVVFQKSDYGSWTIKNFNLYDDEQQKLLMLEKARLSMNYTDIVLPKKVKMNKKYKVGSIGMGDFFGNIGNKNGIDITAKLKDIITKENIEYAIFDMTMMIRLETKNPYTHEELKMVFDMSGDYVVSMDGKMNSESNLKGKISYQMSVIDAGEMVKMTFTIDGIFQRSISIEDAPEFDAASIGNLINL